MWAVFACVKGSYTESSSLRTCTWCLYSKNNVGLQDLPTLDFTRAERPWKNLPNQQACVFILKKIPPSIIEINRESKGGVKGAKGK